MNLESRSYFWFANYYRYFASLVQQRTRPKIIAITGSAGKSTSLYLIAHLLQKKYTVKKSKKANSAIGVPLDILDIQMDSFRTIDWLKTLFIVPWRTIKKLLVPQRTEFYLVELDVDRPGEMEFFAKFLFPECIFWVSSYATHTANFATVMQQGLYANAEHAVASEFAKILDNVSKTGSVIFNGDSQYIVDAVKDTIGRSESKLFKLSKDSKNYGIKSWQIYRKRTEFELYVDHKLRIVTIPYILPKTIGYTLLALYVIAKEYGLTNEDVENVLNEFTLLPSRGTILDGVSNTTLIDSTYNSSYYATVSLLEVLVNYPGKRKVTVLGDMRELGSESQREHERLAAEIVKRKVDQVVLVGPMMKEYALPYLLSNGYDVNSAHHFDNSYQAGLFIKERLIKDGDTILLKASQNTLFFELIVEMLLENKEDATKLCRRETIWENKRAQIKKEFYDTLK